MADDKIEYYGEVFSTKGNGFFLVRIDTGADILCTLSGKIRRNNIMVLDGDNVKIEISPYDLTRGIITFRNRK